MIFLFIARRLSAYFTVVHMAILYGLFVPDWEYQLPSEGTSVVTRTFTIDEDILLEVIKMGFDRNQLTEFLRSRVQNEATVAYYLLMDNRFRATSDYLGAEFQESMWVGIPASANSVTMV
ncbi:hypothetical protein IFM89_023260 [Coptis chinensis]|uniref:UBA domain-containing protein n=1 Tax=Coptis chinensis TaxID=261450 RepID=A0A835LFC7_9MAGN|nr:hypothetical protein IFM89_023260 [Coptis chinensis]